MTETVHRYELTSLEHRVERLETDRLARTARNDWILNGALFLIGYTTFVVAIVVAIMENR